MSWLGDWFGSKGSNSHKYSIKTESGSIYTITYGGRDKAFGYDMWLISNEKRKGILLGFAKNNFALVANYINIDSNSLITAIRVVTANIGKEMKDKSCIGKQIFFVSGEEDINRSLNEEKATKKPGNFPRFSQTSLIVDINPA